MYSLAICGFFVSSFEICLWAMCVFSVFCLKSVLKFYFWAMWGSQFPISNLFIRNVWLFRRQISVLKSSWAMFAVAGLVWRVCVTQVTAMEPTDNCNCAAHVHINSLCFSNLRNEALLKNMTQSGLGLAWIWFLFNFQTEELKRSKTISLNTHS